MVIMGADDPASVSRYEFEDLKARVGRSEARLDDIDRSGTRGVALLALQVQTLTTSIGESKADLAAHRAEHKSNRRWFITAIAVYLGALGGLYPYLGALVHH